ncbi:hypothetical protein Pan44_31500 [Caulifigura coniformis]|uniref:Uncharacterized protein n=1 Tax=Caulifigura coniformis TaxID=2527983 RepID=A0A517SG58_9PLAN|nr:hypothetical protein Pan44_31500 [Caulifigura coniformis]
MTATPHPNDNEARFVRRRPDWGGVGSGQRGCGGEQEGNEDGRNGANPWARQEVARKGGPVGRVWGTAATAEMGKMCVRFFSVLEKNRDWLVNAR